MPFIVEQRKPSSALPMCKQWSECAGSKGDKDHAEQESRYWQGVYDVEYQLKGWEYRIREVKK